VRAIGNEKTVAELSKGGIIPNAASSKRTTSDALVTSHSDNSQPKPGQQLAVPTTEQQIKTTIT